MQSSTTGRSLKKKKKFAIEFFPCCFRVYFWFLLPAARILNLSPLLARRNRCEVCFLWSLLLESMAPSAVLLREAEVFQILCHSTFSPFFGSNTREPGALSWLHLPFFFYILRTTAFPQCGSESRETQGLESSTFSKCCNEPELVRLLDAVDGWNLTRVLGSSFL